MQKFIIIFVLLMSSAMVTVGSNLNNTRIQAGFCDSSRDCYNGICTENICVCEKGYITWKNSEPCGYEQYSQLIAFLLSLFLGGLGVDWFVLAKGNAGYIAAGVFKLLTGGGCGVWWIVDVIRLAVNKFNDGNGAPLKSW